MDFFKMFITPRVCKNTLKSISTSFFFNAFISDPNSSNDAGNYTNHNSGKVTANSKNKPALKNSAGAAMVELAFVMVILAGTIIATMVYYETYKEAEASLRVALGDSNSGVLRATVVSNSLGSAPTASATGIYDKQVGAFAGEVDEAYGIIHSLSGGVCANLVRYECKGGAAPDCGMVSMIPHNTEIVCSHEDGEGQRVYHTFNTANEAGLFSALESLDATSVADKIKRTACLEGCENSQLWSAGCTDAKTCVMYISFSFPKNYPELARTKLVFKTESQPLPIEEAVVTTTPTPVGGGGSGY